nr:DNA mismatch repair protein MSH4 [Ipomoea batatas]
MLIKNLAATEPSALGLHSYYKQYYLCLAAAAATIKWTEAEKRVIVTNHSLLCPELGDNRANALWPFGDKQQEEKPIPNA